MTMTQDIQDRIDLAHQMYEERGQHRPTYAEALVDFLSEDIGAGGPSELQLMSAVTGLPICAICDDAIAQARTEITSRAGRQYAMLCDRCCDIENSDECSVYVIGPLP